MARIGIFLCLIGLFIVSATLKALITVGKGTSSQTLIQKVPSKWHPLKVGDVAPNFLLSDEYHKQHVLLAHENKKTTLVFFCGCDRCRHMAKAIGLLQKKHFDLPFVAVVSLPPNAISTFRQETGFQGLMLSDPEDIVTTAYNSVLCPRVWQVSSDGLICFRSQKLLERTSAKEALQTIATSDSSL